MAKQSGSYTITGTIDHLCFYTMEGKFYVRSKSSLTGRRVKQDPVFKNTMRYAAILSAASGIASEVYQQIPPTEKIKGLYRRITGAAMQLLKSGNCKAEVVQALQAIYAYKPAEKPTAMAKRAAIAPSLFAALLLQSIFADCSIESGVFINKQYIGNPP